MTCRITVVFEYPSVDDVPRIGLTTPLAEYGTPRICAMQFSDALRELEVLEDRATTAAKDAAFAASYDYPGCTDPRRPSTTSGNQP
jgi:hypothetical protein